MKSSLFTEYGRTTTVHEEKSEMIVQTPPFDIIEFYNEKRMRPNPVVEAGGGVPVEFERVITFPSVKGVIIAGQDITTTSVWEFLFWSGHDKKDSAHSRHAGVGIRLTKMLNSAQKYICCKWRVSIVDKHGTALHAPQWRSWEKACKINVGDSHIKPDFILLEQLMENRELYMPNNVMHLKIDVILYSDFINTPKIFERNRFKCSSPLSKSLWPDMQFADLQLTGAEGTDVPAHKLILSGASPVIHGMLTTLPPGGKLSLEDLTELELRQLLELIYTETIKREQGPDLEEIQRLLEISGKYEIRDLRKYALTKALSSLQLNTFPQVTELFQRHQNMVDPMYRAALHEYLMKNQGQLTQSAEFQQFAKEKKEAFLYVALYDNTL